MTWTSDDGDPLEFALLALISVKPMSGYDLAQAFDHALSSWWTAPRSQIYPRLKQMEREGRVTSEEIIQSGRPNKRVYQLTAAGNEYLHQRLLYEIGPPTMNHGMLMRVFLSHEVEPERLSELIGDYADSTEAWINELRQIRAGLVPKVGSARGQKAHSQLLVNEHLLEMASLELKGARRLAESIRQIPDTIAGARARELAVRFRGDGVPGPLEGLASGDAVADLVQDGVGEVADIDEPGLGVDG